MFIMIGKKIHNKLLRNFFKDPNFKQFIWLFKSQKMKESNLTPTNLVYKILLPLFHINWISKAIFLKNKI